MGYALVRNTGPINLSQIYTKTKLPFTQVCFPLEYEYSATLQSKNE